MACTLSSGDVSAAVPILRNTRLGLICIESGMSIFVCWQLDGQSEHSHDSTSRLRTVWDQMDRVGTLLFSFATQFSTRPDKSLQRDFSARGSKHKIYSSTKRALKVGYKNLRLLGFPYHMVAFPSDSSFWSAVSDRTNTCCTNRQIFDKHFVVRTKLYMGCSSNQSKFPNFRYREQCSLHKSFSIYD